MCEFQFGHSYLNMPSWTYILHLTCKNFHYQNKDFVPSSHATHFESNEALPFMWNITDATNTRVNFLAVWGQDNSNHTVRKLRGKIKQLSGFDSRQAQQLPEIFLRTTGTRNKESLVSPGVKWPERKAVHHLHLLPRLRKEEGKSPRLCLPGDKVNFIFDKD
jgi:hypothetical protein